MARHGKFLDLAFGEPGLHLVVHLARGGWLRWRDDLAGARPARPGKGPLAARVRFTPDETGRTPGFELTEAGTQKRLAIHVVRDPAEVPGVAALGPDPLARRLHLQELGRIVGGSRTRIKGLLRDQRVIAGIGNAYSDEVLHAARMSPFKIAGTLTDAQVADLHEAIVTTLREAVERPRGLAAADLKAEKRSGLRVHGRTGRAVPGLRGHDPGGVLRRLVPAVLPDLPDRRQAARRPAACPGCSSDRRAGRGGPGGGCAAPGCQNGRVNVPETPVHAVPDDAFLLDVREPEEWVAGHAPGAVHIPLFELPARVGGGARGRHRLRGVPGRRALGAGDRVAQPARARAVNVAGGMMAWAAAARPMVAENGQQPYVA